MKRPEQIDNQTIKVFEGAVQADADRLADFVLFTQRSCILNLSNELNRGNISFPQFFLLAYLSSEDYLTMGDVAKKMGHSTGAATGLVDRLEKLGYTERIHAPEDRRKIMVRITHKGSELIAHLRKEIASNLAEIMSEMDDEEAESKFEAKEIARKEFRDWRRKAEALSEKVEKQSEKTR